MSNATPHKTTPHLTTYQIVRATLADAKEPMSAQFIATSIGRSVDYVNAALKLLHAEKLAHIKEKAGHRSMWVWGEGENAKAVRRPKPRPPKRPAALFQPKEGDDIAALACRLAERNPEWSMTRCMTRARIEWMKGGGV